MYKALHGMAPDYLRELCRSVSEDDDRGSLRSAERGDLIVPRERRQRKYDTKYDCSTKYKLLCPRGTQTCALAVANINVNGNGKVILDTHPESDQHQN